MAVERAAAGRVTVAETVAGMEEVTAVVKEAEQVEMVDLDMAALAAVATVEVAMAVGGASSWGRIAPMYCSE